MQRLLWSYVESDVLIFHLPNQVEQRRLAELMEQYRDRPMDLADASLVAAAETLRQTRVFTLDADFHIYRLHGATPFEVAP